MSEASKFRLDLPLVLPDVPDVEDRCVGRLTSHSRRPTRRSTRFTLVYCAGPTTDPK